MESVQEFYALQVRQEWRRLVMDAYHRLEFDTTLHFMEKYIPKNGSVLDAGCGPGRYSVELAQRGYDMTLFDLAQPNLDFARRQFRHKGILRRLSRVEQGSIADLSRFPSATFDAVICTGGPLSHLLDAKERARAVGELVRVAKPGAPIFVSVISRLAVLVVELRIAQDELTMPLFQPLRDDGDYSGSRGFTACHFYLPEELRREFSHEGVDVLEMAGLEGIASGHPRELNRVARDPERWKVWRKTHLLTCTHPAVVGVSEHMLIICRKHLP